MKDGVYWYVGTEDGSFAIFSIGEKVHRLTIENGQAAWGGNKLHPNAEWLAWASRQQHFTNYWDAWAELCRRKQKVKEAQCKK